MAVSILYGNPILDTKPDRVDFWLNCHPLRQRLMTKMLAKPMQKTIIHIWGAPRPRWVSLCFTYIWPASWSLGCWPAD